MFENFFMSKQARLDTERAHGLGWASIGIGLTELLAPKQLQQAMGLDDRPDHRGVLRILGVREVLHGVGILSNDRPSKEMATAVWSRVAGDVLDSALLGVAATKTKKAAAFAAISAAVLAIGVADAVMALKLSAD